jgi:rrf2 family protein (putative transcriptional regulator)
MTVLFSKKAEIGIKAILYLSTKNVNEIIDVGVISQELNLPKLFTAKILQQLAREKIIGSKKGKFGGFYITETSMNTKLIKIIEVLDGLEMFGKCMFGFPNCSDDEPCPVHSFWGEIRDKMYKMFSEISLSDMKDDTLIKINFLNKNKQT